MVFFFLLFCRYVNNNGFSEDRKENSAYKLHKLCQHFFHVPGTLTRAPCMKKVHKAVLPGSTNKTRIHQPSTPGPTATLTGFLVAIKYKLWDLTPPSLSECRLINPHVMFLNGSKMAMFSFPKFNGTHEQMMIQGLYETVLGFKSSPLNLQKNILMIKKFYIFFQKWHNYYKGFRDTFYFNHVSSISKDTF